MYHYKSMYFQLFYNNIFSLSQNQPDFLLNENLISYGFGIVLDSPFGPIELIWGKGPEKLSDANNKQTIFHINMLY